MHITFLVLTGLLAVIFAVSGIPKVLNVGFAQGNAEHLGITTLLSRAIGLVEVIAVCGLLAGISIKPVSILTATGIAGLMVGAIGYHLRAKDGPTKLLPAVVTGGLALSLISFTI